MPAERKIHAHITIGIDEETKQPILLCTIPKEQAILMLAGAIQTILLQQKQKSPIITPGNGPGEVPI